MYEFSQGRGGYFLLEHSDEFFYRKFELSSLSQRRVIQFLPKALILAIFDSVHI